MKRIVRKREVTIAALLLALGTVAAVAAWHYKSSGTAAKGMATASLKYGDPRLISVEPLPEMEMDGEMCQLEPVSATEARTLRMMENEADDTEYRPASTQKIKGDYAKRKPARMIRDPYAAYSAVAVDPQNNEVVLTDENLFNIMVYNRLDNTPPKAKMTEPKRVLGGLHTKIEFQCGLYIDPKSGDIYAVNNDTVDSLVIFSRQARGDVPPDREIHTPHGTYGIAVDEEHQELMLTIQHDSALVTYHKDAKREDSPIRLLQGNLTKLADPHGMAFDAKHDIVFVTNHGAVHDKKPATQRNRAGARPAKENWPLDDQVPGSGRNEPPSITVYARTASGNTPPLRVIQGPKTQLDWPTGVAYDPRTDEIFIANDMGDAVLVFPATAQGDVAPTRVIKGPKSHIKFPTGVYIDVEHDELWTANFGNHSATVHRPSASGDTPPLRVIRSGPEGELALGIGNPHPVAYDSKRDELLVPN